MGIFHLFKRNRAERAEPTVTESAVFKASELEAEVKDTPEGHRPMKDVLLPPLLELLRSLCALEEEICARGRQMEAEKIKAGIPKHQTAPGWMELVQEYRERYGQLLSGRCTEQLLSRGYAASYGEPAAYAYLNTGCRLVFIMKSPRKATVETYFSHGVDMKHQFVLRDTEEGWKISEVNYGFQSEPSWHKGHI